MKAKHAQLRYTLQAVPTAVCGHLPAFEPITISRDASYSGNLHPSHMLNTPVYYSLPSSFCQTANIPSCALITGYAIQYVLLRQFTLTNCLPPLLYPFLSTCRSRARLIHSPVHPLQGIRFCFALRCPALCGHFICLGPCPCLA